MNHTNRVGRTFLSAAVAYQIVILSAVAVSQSESATERRIPALTRPTTNASGNSSTNPTRSMQRAAMLSYLRSNL
jgi:hypothetical protein